MVCLAMWSYLSFKAILLCALSSTNLHLVAVNAEYVAASTTPLQDVFQVEAPVRSSYENPSCQQVVLEHEFAASYGTPYVGTYSPPECNFTTTVFNLSVVSAGINYDRLGLIFFGDIEIWRTTTAMPTRTGIFWNFQKDVTVFDSLFRSEQKVIMSMDNLYDSVFTGPFNVTITALYYDDAVTISPAELILPISTQSSAQNESSVISLPDGNATVSVTFPRNAERAVVSIIASGNSAEEFWYTNVPTEYDNTFNNTAIYGYSPWRKVQLFIDDELAGVSWPFPIVFTGGISPGLWVPVVGIDTYDIPSFEIDVSPYLGLLCDGMSHSFELKVVGYNSETVLGTVGSNWWVSGAIFVWIDEGGNQTTGTAITSISPDPLFKFTPEITTNSSGANATLWVELTAQRSLSRSSSITTSTGSRNLSWTQDLFYTNTQNFTNLGRNETLSQLTTGTSTFSPALSDALPISNTFSYPITFYQAYLIPDDAETTNSTLIASLDRSKLSSSISVLTELTIPSITVPSVLATRQNGSCIYFWNNTYYEFAGAIDPATGTIGETEQWFSFTGEDESGDILAYGRHVLAVDGYEPQLVEDDIYSTTIDVPETVL